MTATPTEATDVQRAIELSLEQAHRSSSTGAQPPQIHIAMLPSEPPTSPAKRNITDCIEELRDSLRFVELPRVGHLDGDTLVFIDAPGGYNDPSDPVAIAVLQRYSKPFRVRSSSLKATDSTVFNRMFTPHYQFRILRKRHLVNKLPVGVKYVLDLTPSIEGDDTASLVMELSCSMGVRQWALSLFRWNVSATLVGGSDEFTKWSSQDRLMKWKQAIRSNPKERSRIISRLSDGQVFGDSRMEDPLNLVFDVPQDYTDLRHRSAIERVLLALEGQDPGLNSAPKVFTAAIVASKQLGIAYSPLNDYIVRWLRAEPNSNFIEALPEDTLKIAESIKCASICIDAFAILVGEAALDASSKTHSASTLSAKESLLGRLKADLHEAWQSRLEYARNSFVDRVNSTFTGLIDEKMEWVESLEELRKLVSLDSPSAEYAEAYRKLVAGLKEFIRSSVLCIIRADYNNDFDWMDQDKEQEGDVLYPRINMKGVYEDLDLKERLFTRHFWRILRDLRFLVPREMDFHLHHISYHFSSSRVPSDLWASQSAVGNQESDQNGKFKPVLGDCNYHQAVHKLKELVATCYQLRYLSTTTQQTWPSAQKLTLPFRPAGNVAASFTIEVPPEEDPLLSEEDKITEGWELPITDGDGAGTAPVPQLPHFDLHSSFNIAEFFRDVENHIFRIAGKMLDGPLDGHLGTEFDLKAKITLTRTLVSLQESETKFLPLWAGGLDDGTSGVFENDVPFAEDGFTKPGHSRNFGLGSTSGSSRYEMVGDEGSTIGTSTVVNDGYSDAMDRRRVYVTSDESVSGDSINYSEASSSYAATQRTPTASVDDTSEWEQLATAGGDDAMTDIHEYIPETILQPPRDPEMYDDIFDSDNDADAGDFEYESDEFEESESYRGFDSVEMEVVEHSEPVQSATTSTAPVASNGTAANTSASRKGKQPIRRLDTDSDWDNLPDKRRKVEYILYKDGPDDYLMNRP